MDKKLYEASLQGNVTSLLNLLHEDPLIIHKYMAEPHHTETPLHVTTLLGHVDFVKEILTRRPDLARELDSRRSTALHLVAATGHVEILRCLLKADVETCTALDRHGMNPAHVAATKGRVDCLKEMMRVRPDAARMVTGNGLTILHLCVKYNQMEAMKLLVEINDVVDDELVNFKDQEGNTILHLAVLDKQSQTVNFLLTSTSIRTESRNAYGLTALDISKLHSNHMSIQEALRRHGCQPSAARLFSQSTIPTAASIRLLQPIEMLLERLIMDQKEQQTENRRNSILIAATVIASMSFQVAANPPGGGSPANYSLFLVFNTAAFCGSAVVFLMLLSKLPLLVNNKYVIGAFNVALWLAILSLMASFTCSLYFTSQMDDEPGIALRAGSIVMYLAFTLSGTLFIGHIVRFIRTRAQICNARTQSSTGIISS